MITVKTSLDGEEHVQHTASQYWALFRGRHVTFSLEADLIDISIPDSVPDETETNIE